LILSRASAKLLALAASLLLPGAALQPALSAQAQTQAQSPAQSPAPPPTSQPDSAPAPPLPTRVFGFRDFTHQAALDQQFLAVPSRDLAREHLKALTAAPHWASSPEDYATALYVANCFKAAGLDTKIVPYSVLLPKPTSILVEAFDAAGKKILAGPTPELPISASSQPLSAQTATQPPPDPRVIPAFNSSSPSADITAPIVYANYGRRADFERLAQLGISVRGKIVLVRYGESYRGTKVYVAQQFGAKGVLLYTDPADSDAKNAQPYPAGPNPPNTAVQRGSVQFLPIYPGDPTTPGVASVPNLPAADRIPASQLRYDLPSIPVDPLSAADAAPILRALAGPAAPRDWQGADLGSPYHLGSSEAPVTVHMRLAFDARLRTIWDVIGRIPGTAEPQQLVIAGNHRDAWVYGATDPGSGTAAMLETVHGLAVLLAHGWRPRRTIVLASWDGEEEGLIGSTEWVEQHAADLAHAVAYFNIDEAASGPAFSAAAVPSLHQFLREIAREVPSPLGGSVFDQWKAAEQISDARSNPALSSSAPLATEFPQQRLSDSPRIGDLGSGSDYSPFLDHAGISSSDIGSNGPFGVYHSVFDNFDWFTRFADPTFAYTQQQARILGLEILHMASADVLPNDEVAYAEAIRIYLDQARARSLKNEARDSNDSSSPKDARALKLDFAPALAAADNFLAAARAMHSLQLESTPGRGPQSDPQLDAALIAAEHALLLPTGLPQRPWYRQAIYAPGLLTGYAAETLPGVNDALDAADAPRAQAQLDALAAALTRAVAALQSLAR